MASTTGQPTPAQTAARQIADFDRIAPVTYLIVGLAIVVGLLGPTGFSVVVGLVVVASWYRYSRSVDQLVARTDSDSCAAVESAANAHRAMLLVAAAPVLAVGTILAALA